MPERHLEWARDRVRRLLDAGEPDRLILIAVASVDFAASIRGRSRRLTSAADKALMFAWREVADVLLVGARTLEVERYGSLLPPELEQLRESRGAPAWPPIVTVSRSGELEFERIMRANTPPALTVYGPVEPAPTQWPVSWRETTAPDLLTAAIADLRQQGVRTIVCEGGPTVFALLVEAGLATDYSLTVAPSLVGGEGPIFHPEMRGRPHPVRTADVTAVDGHVFAHYAF